MEKRKSKLLLSLLLIFSITRVSAQGEDNLRSIEVRGGLTLTPGTYISVRHERYVNYFMNVSLNVHGEFSNKNRLKYSAYGFDLVGESYSLLGESTNHQFELKGGLGLTMQIENEPWIYKNLSSSKRINYGFLGEVAGEWSIAEEFNLTMFVQQKYLLVKELGQTRFLFGLGVKFKIPEL